MSGVCTFLGSRESGKSYLANKLSLKKRKVIIFDYAKCFRDGEIVEVNPKNMARLIVQFGGVKNRNKKMRLIFRAPRLMDDRTAANIVARFGFSLGQSFGNPNEGSGLPKDERIVLLADEVDKYSSSKKEDMFTLAINKGRHDNLDLWAIAQDPARLDPAFKRQASFIYAFRLGDNQFYRSVFGNKIARELETLKQWHHYRWQDTGEISLFNDKGKKVNL